MATPGHPWGSPQLAPSTRGWVRAIRSQRREHSSLSPGFEDPKEMPWFLGFPGDEDARKLRRALGSVQTLKRAVSSQPADMIDAEVVPSGLRGSSPSQREALL